MDRYDEMVKRVKEVADYAIETGASTRQIAKYFSEHRFKISNATVCVYLSQRLPRIDLERYKLVKPIIDKNTPKTVETVATRKRIYLAAQLLLQGLTIPQIVEEINASSDEKVTFDIIYDDLTRRLEKIEKDEQILKDVKTRLSENRFSTLNNQNGNGANYKARLQSRVNGKFVKVVEEVHENKKSL